MTALLVFPAGKIDAQSAMQSAGGVDVAGVVVDASGTPVVGATVLLEDGGSLPATLKTLTVGGGRFLLWCPHPGAYNLRAGKSGFQDVAMGPLTISDSEPRNFKLVLKALHGSAAASSPDSHSSSSPSSSSSTVMQFADTPSFTVAGITDWTAAGGHGADTNLRTSETLAKETMALKQSSSPTAAGTNGKGTSRDDEGALKSALLKNPMSFEANRSLGEFYLASGQYREAIPFFDSAHRIAPRDYSNEYDLAVAYKAAGDFTKARDQARQTLFLEDKSELHRLLGDVDEQLNDPLAAVNEYERATKLDPSEENYFSWGTELLLHRAIEPAVEVFTRGAKLHGGSERMLAGLGATLYANGSYDEGALRMCAASDLNPTDSGPYIFLGQMDMAAPDPLPCAQQKLVQFASDQPQNAFANYYYAVALWKRQHPPYDHAVARQVEDLLKKGTALDPKFAEAYLELGILYSTVDNSEFNTQLAIDALVKAIEQDSNLGEAHYRLAVIYQRMGNEAKAREEFKLHDECEKTQADAVERQRREIRQFMVVLKGQTPPSSSR